jgi:hypothetical protein
MPQLNKSIAKAYLSSKSPELITRQWSHVMERYAKTGGLASNDRKERVFQSRPFMLLRPVKLIDTEVAHFLPF